MMEKRIVIEGATNWFERLSNDLYLLDEITVEKRVSSDLISSTLDWEHKTMVFNLKYIYIHNANHSRMTRIDYTFVFYL